MSPSTLPQMRPVKVSLPGLPQGPLSPAQQAEALRRIQAQAEQRVQLGVQLFKAAESQATQHKQMLDEVKAEHASFRSEIEEDIARSFHAYDTWIGQADADLTGSIKKLEEKMEKLQSEWQSTQARIEGMVERSEKLLAQTRDLMNTGRVTPRPAVEPAFAAPGTAPVPMVDTPDEITRLPAPPATMDAPAMDLQANPELQALSGAAGQSTQLPPEAIPPDATPEAIPEPADLPPNFYTKLVDRLDGEGAANP